MSVADELAAAIMGLPNSEDLPAGFRWGRQEVLACRVGRRDMRAAAAHLVAASDALRRLEASHARLLDLCRRAFAVAGMPNGLAADLDEAIRAAGGE